MASEELPSDESTVHLLITRSSPQQYAKKWVPEEKEGPDVKTRICRGLSLKIILARFGGVMVVKY